MNSTKLAEVSAMNSCQDLPPLSVPYAADIITLDEALFSCPVRTLPLSLLDVSVYLAEITPLSQRSCCNEKMLIVPST